MNDFIPIERCHFCGSTDIEYNEVPPHHIEARCRACGKWNQYVTQVNEDNWKKLVKERDGYTCVRCGKRLTPRTADAHHKLPVWFMPDMATDLNNGICLCKDCHKQLHGAGGVIKEETT